jgi:hypothetical protein
VIHWSLVATIFSRSALVSNRGGTYVPTELIFTRTLCRAFNVRLNPSPHCLFWPNPAPNHSLRPAPQEQVQPYAIVSLSVLAVILSASFEREGPRRSSPRQYRPNLSPNNATVISSLFVILNGVKNPRISSLLVLACHSAA